MLYNPGRMAVDSSGYKALSKSIFLTAWCAMVVVLCCCNSAVLEPYGGEEAAGEPDGGSTEAVTGDEMEPAETEDEPDAASGCGQALDLIERERLDVPSSTGSVPLERCSAHRWHLVAPARMKLAVTLHAEGSDVLVASLNYPDMPGLQDKLAQLSAAPGYDGTLEFIPPRSGEFFLQVRSMDPERPSGYAVSVECLENCDLRCTRYPILLVHGWTGFKNIGPIEYFYNVPDDLERLGYLPLVAVLDPYNSVEVRSGQLAEQVDRFLEDTHSLKLDIVAHSQGGLDSRRVISTLGYGDRISALVTIATPHRGTPIADIGLGLLPGPAEDALAFLLNLIGAAGGHESDAMASFASLTTSYVEQQFNPANPDDPRVDYISWTGLTCILGDCGDICDVEIQWAYLLIKDAAGDNDGMVPVESAVWGDYQGTIPADHFDEIGQVAGITGPNFDHIEFYRSVADLLRTRGH
ncbi:MAG: triacylglycerol lipase [Deltaproteobacteria bacterium]|nr:MAG: triacylglycerol lipase [Deltaproteobacteria bacterium]